MAELTPYDTGVRAEPKVWPLGAYQDDHPDGRNGAFDSYGKVDFEDDSGEHLATIWLERNEHSGNYVINIVRGPAPIGLNVMLGGD